MENKRPRSLIFGALLMSSMALAACATVKEKTAPCKRPAGLMSYVGDPHTKCAMMMPVNDPNVAFAAIGIVE